MHSCSRWIRVGHGPPFSPSLHLSRSRPSQGPTSPCHPPQPSMIQVIRLPTVRSLTLHLKLHSTKDHAYNATLHPVIGHRHFSTFLNDISLLTTFPTESHSPLQANSCSTLQWCSTLHHLQPCSHPSLAIIHSPSNSSKTYIHIYASSSRPTFIGETFVFSSSFTLCVWRTNDPIFEQINFFYINKWNLCICYKSK